MDLTLRSFRVSSEGLAENPEFVGWWRAVRAGFLAPDPQDAALEWALRGSAADGWLQRGCYDADLPAVALGGDSPVGTYMSFEKPLNVGGTTIPAHLITDVTVRPTHRRRGILRQLMLRDLTEARERGLALAALTVTEATIYGRFGFAPATFAHAVRVDPRRFAVRSAPPGRVELTSPELMTQLAPAIFARHLAATPGALGRQSLFAGRATGLFDPHLGGRNRRVRNALHFDAAGQPDGFVCYELSDDWHDRELTIRDLVASDAHAYLGLWDYLAGIDLVKRIEWRQAPVEDPARWAVVDPHAYQVTAVSDLLWLRILDPVAALSARAYDCPDTDVTLGITDELGFAEGTYRLAVRGCRAEVTRSTETPDAVLDVADLGSLYLGGIAARELQAAGRLGLDPAVVSQLDRLLMGPQRPYCNTHF